MSRSVSLRYGLPKLRPVLVFLFAFFYGFPAGSHAEEFKQYYFMDETAALPGEEVVVPDPTYRIGTITIITGEVFDLSNPEENGLVGVVADKIHINTREGTIRNDLLFKEGDFYDKELMDETERNLRQRPFLTGVEITTKANKEIKTVDVTVRSRDQWTLLIGSAVGGTNQNSMVGGDIGEQNFLGFGQSISYSYRQDNSGSYNSAGFSDQNLLGSRYALAVNYSQTPIEIDNTFSFQQPFYSLGTETSQGATYGTVDHFEPALRYNNFRLVTFYAVAYELGGVITRPAFVVSLGEQTVYSSASQPVVTRDNKLELQVSLLAEPRNFTKESYVQKFRTVEDIPLGAQYSFLIGEGMVAIGSTTTEISSSFLASKWSRFLDRDYFYAGLLLTENDDNYNRQLVDFQLQYFFRRYLSHSLFFNIQASYDDSDVNRYYLGATTGLRGFAINQFVGRDRVMLNFEDRIFTYKSILWGIVEPGFVLFADAGDAWNNFGGDTFHGLHTDVGVGIRLGLLKAPGVSLVHIDYGIPLGLNGAPVISMGVSGTF